MLEGENIGEFGIQLEIQQSFLPQIYRVFNIYLPLIGHLPMFSPPKRLNG